MLWRRAILCLPTVVVVMSMEDVSQRPSTRLLDTHARIGTERKQRHPRRRCGRQSGLGTPLQDSHTPQSRLPTAPGRVALEDITKRTIEINRKAEDLQGDYDGWETSVERK